MRHILLAIAMLLTLCCCANPYIGLRVKTEDPTWCRVYAFPNSCTIKTDALEFVYKTEFDNLSGEYTVTGYAVPVNIKAFDRIDLAESNIYFILAKDGVVTDVISFIIMSEDLHSKIPFRVKFKTKPFDSMTISYKLSVSAC